MDKQKETNLEFDINNPTEENISFIFNSILLNINAAIDLNVYYSYQTDLSVSLNKVKDMFTLYASCKDLKKINDKELIDLREKLVSLSEATKTLQPQYIRWSLDWLEIIISLRESELEINKPNNKK